jgi:hypothetical protein
MERRDWMGGPLVAEQARAAASWASNHIEAVLTSGLAAWQYPCDSPIEVVFAMWWAATTTAYEIGGVHPLEDGYGFSVQDWALVPQQRVEIDGVTYRLDFEIVNSNPGHQKLLSDAKLPRIAVELDGHEFHERSKEQVIHRDSRDRALQRAGWQVLHFSGSEVVRFPQRCVFEGLQAAHDLLNQYNERQDAAARRDRPGETT